MQTITVEWRHLDKEGKTCDRCQTTGQTIIEAVRGLAEECGPRGVAIVFRETRLTEAEIDQSNLVLINGTPIEELLPHTFASTSSCCSCGELTGRGEENCRTLVRLGQIHEAIPTQFIREAVCTVAGCC